MVLTEYVMTSCGWLTSGPPRVTDGLKPMVSAPPTVVVPVPLGPEPLPSPWGKSRAEMSVVDIGGRTSATIVSTTATPAALLPNRQPSPSSAVMRDAAQRSPSDPRYAAATTASASTTAIVSGSAIGSGFSALTTFVARTEKIGITARTPRCSRSTIHPSQYPQRKRIAHRPTVKSQSCVEASPVNERAQVVPGDGARGLTWNRRHRRECGGTIAASPRNGAAIAAAMRGARAWASSAASITDVTATTIAPPPP